MDAHQHSLLGTLVDNQDHLWLFLTALGALLTCYIAYHALRSWQDEKKYDIIIENLQLCNVAVDFIRYLRSPVRYDDEISEENMKRMNEDNESLDRQALAAKKAVYIYYARKERSIETYNRIIKLRETDWAVFGPEHEFYKFYNRIVEIDDQIRVAALRRYYTLKDREEFGEEELREMKSETRSTMFELNNDSIAAELDKLVKEMQTHRVKHKI